jgi:hypothetical protein
VHLHCPIGPARSIYKLLIARWGCLGNLRWAETAYRTASMSRRSGFKCYGTISIFGLASNWQSSVRIKDFLSTRYFFPVNRLDNKHQAKCGRTRPLLRAPDGCLQVGSRLPLSFFSSSRTSRWCSQLSLCPSPGRASYKKLSWTVSYFPVDVNDGSREQLQCNPSYLTIRSRALKKRAT